MCHGHVRQDSGAWGASALQIGREESQCGKEGKCQRSLFPSTMDAVAPTEERQTLVSPSRLWAIGDVELRTSVNVANTIVNLFKTVSSFAVCFVT